MNTLCKILIFNSLLLFVPLVVWAQDDTIESVTDTTEYVYALPGVTKMFEVDDSFAAIDEEIVINPDFPEGLIYQIQALTLFSNTNYSRFKGLYPVFATQASGSREIKFYVGLFRTRDEASAALAQVRSKGFSDAFIANRLSGQIVNAARATELEKDWANVPFSYSANGVITEPIEQDTLPAVLNYRVELVRSKLPVNSSEVEAMRAIAGGRGLDIYNLSDGNIVYLVGSFVTLESAEEYADLVSRNGFSSAMVTAWLGTMELPMETAQMLFDSVQ